MGEEFVLLDGRFASSHNVKRDKTPILSISGTYAVSWHATLRLCAAMLVDNYPILLVIITIMITIANITEIIRRFLSRLASFQVSFPFPVAEKNKEKKISQLFLDRVGISLGKVTMR